MLKAELRVTSYEFLQNPYAQVMPSLEFLTVSIGGIILVIFHSTTAVRKHLL
jgi:hypothetical protein